MKKSRFTDEQITAILAEVRAGANTADVCRRHGISTKTFYGWRTKFGGMQSSEVRRVKNLEEENSRLKRLVASQALELQAAKEVIKGKW